MSKWFSRSFFIFSRDWKGDMSFRFGVWGLKKRCMAAHTTVKSDSTSPWHQAKEVRKERKKKGMKKHKIALRCTTFSQTMNKQVTIDVIFLQLQTVSYIIKVHFSYQHFLNCTQVSTSFWTSFVLVRSFGILLCRKLFKKVSFTQKVSVH